MSFDAYRRGLHSGSVMSVSAVLRFMSYLHHKVITIFDAILKFMSAKGISANFNIKLHHQ